MSVTRCEVCERHVDTDFVMTYEVCEDCIEDVSIKHSLGEIHRKLLEARDGEYRKTETIMKALRHLDGATPRQRNGPCYKAADILRAALGLPPMSIGGKPTEGMDEALQGAKEAAYVATPAREV